MNTAIDDEEQLAVILAKPATFANRTIVSVMHGGLVRLTFAETSNPEGPFVIRGSYVLTQADAMGLAGLIQAMLATAPAEGEGGH